MVRIKYRRTMKYCLRLEDNNEPLATFDSEEEAKAHKWDYQCNYISRVVLVEPC